MSVRISTARTGRRRPLSIARFHPNEFGREALLSLLGGRPADVRVVCPPGIAAVVRAPEFERMTQRELEVIDLIGAGLSNKGIAERLNITSHTLKTHVRNVMVKLAVHTRLQIATHSYRERTT